MSLHLQYFHVATASEDNEGQLVFVDGSLVAVLERLSKQHDDGAGMWFVEAGFGDVHVSNPSPFADLDEAQAWMMGRFAKA